MQFLTKSFVLVLLSYSNLSLGLQRKNSFEKKDLMNLCNKRVNL